MFSDSTHETGAGPCRSRRGRGAAHGSSRHRHGGFWGGPGGFPGGGFPGGGGPYGRARKARRGDIRTAALLLIAEEPRNGYQIMQEIEERSEGVWRPSAGSVYPALAQLEDEGLIRSHESDGRKLLTLTDAGRKLLEERDADQPAPWQQISGQVGDEAMQLGKMMRAMAQAFVQVVRTGTPEQLARAREILDRARRDLYRILADDEQSEGTIVDGDA